MGSVSAVLDGELYLGNAHASSDEALLRRLEIQRVVSVGCRTRALDGVRWFHVGVLDRGNQDITACLPEMAAFIEDGLSQGERVLVHCRAGICRSPALVAGFLAYSGRVPQISEALKLVRARRSIARIRPEFIAQLEERFPASEPNGGAGAAAASTGASGDRNGLRLIFLDIDGVLLPIVAGSHNQTFPDRCLSALSRVLDATGATIVLSSTWRVDTSAIDHITEEFKRFAREHAGPLGEVLGFQYMTDPQNHSVRQWEIAQWLASFDGRETVESWVALDDDESIVQDMRYADEFSGHAVLVDSAVGLTEENADAAIQILLSRCPGALGRKKDADEDETKKTRKKRRR
mmetsp:Transcript_9795/g.27736  ORF Transcript_9795/g.27736 Transcript_9795/m.27736 type:complete len:348 (-) Transcript_9795:90-1133(-)